MTLLPPMNLTTINIPYLIDVAPLVFFWLVVFMMWYWLGFTVADSAVDSFMFRVVGTTILFLTVILTLITIGIGLNTIWQHIR